MSANKEFYYQLFFTACLWGAVCAVLQYSWQQQVHCAFIADDTREYEPHRELITALHDTAAAHGVALAIHSVDPQRMTQDRGRTRRLLQSMDGVIMPSGFHDRGFAEKIVIARWAREHNVPYLGICLGMQVLLIEAARNLLGYAEADSVEFNPQTPVPLIAQMDEDDTILRERCAMRHGYYPCMVSPGTQAHAALGNELVEGFHAHWFECNLQFIPDLESVGLRAAGRCPEGGFMEIVEVGDHPFMMGVQFHPEHDSSYEKPHPLLARFIEKCAEARVHT